MTESTRRAARGATWLYLSRWIERLLDFGAIVLLARLLSPDDFGLVAIAASMVAIVEGLAAFDVNKALIQRRDDDRALFDSAWTLSALRGLVSASIMVALSPLLKDPRIGEVLLALALSPILTGLINPRFVAFERDLIFSRPAVLSLTSKVGSVAVTLTIAILTRSYWALVVGTLAASALTLVLSYVLRPYRPRPSLARFRDIFGFSGWLSLTTAVTTLSMEPDKLIVGKFLGVADAGRYFMTQRVGVLPTRELVSPLQRLLFPSFSELATEPERLRRVVRESINVLGSLSLPAGVGFALVARDFVPLALGDQWLAIVPLIMILVPYLGARATLSMALPCMLALGLTRTLFWVSLVYALVHVPTFVAGTYLFGLQGAIWSLVAAGVIYTCLNAWMLRRAVGITLREILGQLRRPFLATVAMTVAVLATSELQAVGPLARLALGVTVGAATYAAALLALWQLDGKPQGIEHRFFQLLGR
ncbi:MAG: lipopolysaccharide biosynthesis protein [Thermoanaerobaculia bacterium]|nr:lipopolysaccharide biosynthesis protein [Thermoanaerobaculia bacterium]